MSAGPVAAVSLRPARPEDLQAMRAVETACFGRDAWGEPALREELAGVPETRHVVVAVAPELVAGHGPSIVGYGSLLAVGTTADVQRVAVLPEWQRHGIGRRLLVTLVAHARDRGCDEALLEVRDDNAAALAMYDAAGFAVIARRKGYYHETTDALVLRLAPLTGDR